jgi:aminoglycoside 3-N-acetyltransferase
VTETAKSAQSHSAPEHARSAPEPGHDHGHDRLRHDLLELGVRRGTILLVQASLRTVAPAAGGAGLVFDALMDVLGPQGTLVVPTFTSLNSTTSRVHKAIIMSMSEEQRYDYISSLAPFDPLQSPAEGMGVLAEYVRTRPDSVRSTHPHTSFAAVGPQAADLMSVHPLDSHLGPQSPLGRMHDADADSLLLGLDYHQGCTMIHLAEYMVARDQEALGLPVYRRAYRARTVASAAPDKWETFEDLDLDDGDFKQIGAAYDAAGSVPRPGLRRGPVGAAETRLVGSAQIVAFATKWMHTHRH